MEQLELVHCGAGARLDMEQEQGERRPRSAGCFSLDAMMAPRRSLVGDTFVRLPLGGWTGHHGQRLYMDPPQHELTSFSGVDHTKSIYWADVTGGLVLS
jgi:hypothetical protein